MGQPIAVAPREVENEGTGGMGSEIVWRLRVWPKGLPDLTQVDLSDVDDDEARRLVNQVEAVKREFEDFVREDVVPNISQEPSRVGIVKTLRLFSSAHSMNTNYLLLLSGILSGTGGVLDQISERYTISSTEQLGLFSQLETYETRA